MVVVLSGCASTSGNEQEGTGSSGASTSASSQQWDPQSWTPTVKVQPVQMSESEKEQAYQQLLEQRAAELDGPAPDVKRVAWMDSHHEHFAAQAKCEREAGYPAVQHPSGGLIYEEGIPESQKKAHDLASFTCMAQYPLDPTRQQDWREEQLGLVYDYWDQYFIPCMAAHGHPVDSSSKPSRAAYIAAFNTPDRISWWPTETMDRLPLEEQERLVPVCSPLPPDSAMYGLAQ